MAFRTNGQKVYSNVSFNLKERNVELLKRFKHLPRNEKQKTLDFKNDLIISLYIDWRRCFVSSEHFCNYYGITRGQFETISTKAKDILKIVEVK